MASRISKIADIVRELKFRRQRPIVSLIAIRKASDGDIQILMQRRNKVVDGTPYRGYWELPQGKVNRRETIGQTARRELAEETGLTVSRFIVGGESEVSSSAPSSRLTVSHPLVCVLDAVQNHFAVCLVIEAEGVVRETLEAQEHQWTSLARVRELVQSGVVFPLNVPMLELFAARYSPEWLS